MLKDGTEKSQLKKGPKKWLGSTRVNLSNPQFGSWDRDNQ